MHDLMRKDVAIDAEMEAAGLALKATARRRVRLLSSPLIICLLGIGLLELLSARQGRERGESSPAGMALGAPRCALPGNFGPVD